MRKANELSPEHVSEIIQMALSDHVSFANIRAEYGVTDKQVKDTDARHAEKRELQDLAKTGP